jgi:hypothetical protein
VARVGTWLRGPSAGMGGAAVLCLWKVTFEVLVMEPTFIKQILELCIRGGILHSHCLLGIICDGLQKRYFSCGNAGASGNDYSLHSEQARSYAVGQLCYLAIGPSHKLQICAKPAAYFVHQRCTSTALATLKSFRRFPSLVFVLFFKKYDIKMRRLFLATIQHMPL